MRYPPSTLALPILAIDPGKNALGWAYYGQLGFLLACGVVRSETPTTPGGDPVGPVAKHIHRQLHEQIAIYPPAAGLVIEKMKIYPGPHAKGDPDDMIQLSYISGGVQNLPSCWGAEPVLVEAHGWKGQVPKDIFQRDMIKPSLTSSEMALAEASMQAVPKSLKHNGWDAVGIGLWALRRIK
jgi:hypothetical protein